MNHYPYDPDDKDYLYDPAYDENADRYIDINGYPDMIDPATGLEWGIDPTTN